MRWHSSDAFEKRQKKKLFGENNFLHLAFLAPGENYCESAKKKFFSSQKHATRENFMRRLQHRLAFLHSAAFPELLFIDGCIFFSFMIHFDFHNFSLHIFSFHFFSFLLFCAMRWWCFSHQRTIATLKTHLAFVFLHTFRATCLRNQLRSVRSAADHWSDFCMYVGASEALLRNKQHS